MSVPAAAVWIVGDDEPWLVAEQPLQITALADEVLEHGHRWVQVTLASARYPEVNGQPLRVRADLIVAVGAAVVISHGRDDPDDDDG